MKHYKPILALFSTGLSFVRAVDFTIDPNEVELATRESWCKDEMSNCQLLCGDHKVGENGCDHNTLSYSCVCGNGTAPGLQYYAGTMPTYICNQAYDDCIAEANQTEGKSTKDCKDDIKSQCGTLDPATADDVTSATTSSATSTSTSSSSSNSSDTTSPPPSSPSPSNTNNDSTPPSQQDSLTPEAKIGIGLSVTLLAATSIAALAILLHRKRKTRAEQQNRMEQGGISGPFEKLPDETTTAGGGDIAPKSSHSNNTWSSYELPTGTDGRPIELMSPPATAELYGGWSARSSRAASLVVAELPADTTSGWYDDDEDDKMRRVRQVRNNIRFPDFK